METWVRRALLGLVVIFAIVASDTVPKPGHAVFAKIITVSAFCFVLLHSKLAYGWRDTAVFLCFTVAVAFAGEWLSASGGGAGTGFTFGHYHYTSALGPRIAGIPPLVYLAYFCMGYASLTFARLILRDGGSTPRGLGLVSLAVTSSLIMCGWDVAMDPVSSTANAFWIWDKGGVYFGVPIHNYWGWFAVNFLIYAIFLSYRAARGRAEPDPSVEGRTTWAEPILMFVGFSAVIALPPVLGKFPSALHGLVDARLWSGSVRSLIWSSSLIACWTMGVPAVLAVMRLLRRPAQSSGSSVADSPRSSAKTSSPNA